MNDDIIFEDDKDVNDLSLSDNWISFIEDEEPTAEPVVDSAVTEPIVADTAVVDEVITDENKNTESETTDEDVDLDSILDWLQDEIDDSKKVLDDISVTSDSATNVNIWILKDSLTKMEQQLKKLNSEKMDLQFRNAELEAFGIDWLDPKLLSLSRVYAKAKDWDDVSKTKATKIAKEILFDLTGEDIDSAKISSDIDLLTQAELYNNAINPNLKPWKDEDMGMLEL